MERAGSSVRIEVEEHDPTAVVKNMLKQRIETHQWGNAANILEANPEGWTLILNSLGQTALHLAVLSADVDRIVKWVRMVPSHECLEIRDNEGYTPLATIAETGVDIQVAEWIVYRNSNTLTIPTKKGSIPVTLAFDNGHTVLGRYLYFETPADIFHKYFENHGANLLRFCFASRSLVIALNLLGRDKKFLFAKDDSETTTVERIAALPFALFNGTQLIFWKRWIYNYFYSDLPKSRSMRLDAADLLELVCDRGSDLSEEEENIIVKALFRAASAGNVEFINHISKSHPHLMLRSDPKTSWNIFFYAIANRQAEVYNLIDSLSSKNWQSSRRDSSGNTLLHVAAELAPRNTFSNPALQMQRELQWFKEVESLVLPWYAELENNDHLKPQELFKKTHKELRKEAEQWMNNTASSCSVVAILVVTIMFATAFTVPGGNDQTYGFPIFLDKHKKLFMIFIISDIISLFSSTTSVLIFLSILIPRYVEEGFLKSLPIKLIFGLSTLSLSIVTMAITFSVAIIMMLHKMSHLWRYLPVVILASVPVAVVGMLQLPLLVEIFRSTYAPGIIRKKRKVKSWLEV